MVHVSFPSVAARSGIYVLALPARQGAAVRPIASPSATGSSGACWFSQRNREQRYVPLRLPARQGTVVRVGSPSAAGSSGACWFSQRGREQWCVLVLPARQGAAVYTSLILHYCLLSVLIRIVLGLLDFCWVLCLQYFFFSFLAYAS